MKVNKSQNDRINDHLYEPFGLGRFATENINIKNLKKIEFVFSRLVY